MIILTDSKYQAESLLNMAISIDYNVRTYLDAYSCRSAFYSVIFFRPVGEDLKVVRSVRGSGMEPPVRFEVAEPLVGVKWGEKLSHFEK